MSVIKFYSSPSDLLEKLAREGGRTWKSEDINDKADHFFNFCITSLSLRDWCIEFLSLSGKNKNDFFEMHAGNQWLKDCGSIANSSKHFALEVGRKSSVEKVENKTSELVALGVDGKKIEGSESERASFNIITAEGEAKDLALVLYYAVTEWEKVFSEYKIPLPKNEFFKAQMFVEYM
ncbi:hypothetical protein [Vibrio atlanticus]|uniref:hypothetical protein n=1 Tax=Vibrio atlanticus TaxID=693153 RepID=UPI0022B07356|nr:hypothetical protein [Vibrio atlanticus]MCZ4311637.1 hypothetical protein [Vibrio atlanticus]